MACSCSVRVGARGEHARGERPGQPSAAAAAARRADEPRFPDATGSDRTGLNSAPGQTPTPVVLADEPGLARPLRGRTIPESAGTGELPLPPPGARVLASVGGKPVWWQTGEETDGRTASSSASAYPLAGLDDGEALREHLRAGRFMGLLPLVHLLTQVLGGRGLAAAAAASLVRDR